MKLIKPSFEILEQGPGLEGIYEAIERAGRTCYKSKRPAGQTAKNFVDRMIASKHYAMLEHGTVYLTTTNPEVVNKYTVSTKGYNSPYPYVRVNIPHSNNGAFTYYITTNYRFLLEKGWLDDLQYLSEPTEYHEKRVTVRFTTSNGIMREFTRHRSHSFAVESTRYCNYSKDKFDNEITFIVPSWADKELCKDIQEEINNKSCDVPLGVLFPKTECCMIVSWEVAEEAYLSMIVKGSTPQEAREVLPLATKCDMVMTGFVSDWNHFFRLRTSIIAETGKPHPDASALADPLMNEFIKRGYINE